VGGRARDARATTYLRARRQEVPAGAPWVNLLGWGIVLELGGPIPAAGGVTVTIEDRLTIHFAPAGVVVAGGYHPLQLGDAREVVIEPRFDGILLRMPGATPDELKVRLPEGPVVPVRFTTRTEGAATVTGIALIHLPDRATSDPRGVRGESLRRQRQGR
jgi:hypothetical protein